MLQATSTDDRLVAELRASRAPLGTADLATALGLHPNGVRVQLRRLEARGLVEREQERGGRGRPRDRWSVTARAVTESDRPHVGWAMARSLARSIPPTDARLREVEAAGAAMGAELAEALGLEPGDEPRGALDHALGAMGFGPVHEPAEPGRAAYRLTVCPYAEVVKENPAVVCTMHRGILRGVLNRIEAGGEIVRFEPRNPFEAGCGLEVELGDAPTGETA